MVHILFEREHAITANICWSWRRLQHVFSVTILRLPRRLEDILKMPWRGLEEVLKTSWRRLEKVLKTSSRHMVKTDILVLTKTSWRRLQDFFWRRKAKANIIVLIKTPRRRLHQEECLLGYLWNNPVTGLT